MPRKPKLKLTSFYIEPLDLLAVEKLAEFRDSFELESVSAGEIIRRAIKAYVADNFYVAAREAMDAEKKAKATKKKLPFS